MYAHDAEVAEDAEKRAEASSLEERQRYQPFLEIAERYAADAGMVVSGESATRLLLGSTGSAPPARKAGPGPAKPAATGARPGSSGPPPVRFDSFTLALQGAGAAEHAAALARAFHASAPSGLGHFAAVFPRSGGQHAVSVDGRDLVTVEEPAAVHGLQAVAVLPPSNRPAQFAADPAGAPLELACVGPELRLLATYAALCDPARAGEWLPLLAAEAGLRVLMCSEIRAKLQASLSTVGGAEDARRSAFLAKVLAEFAPGAGRVLVGAEAAALLAEHGPGGRAPKHRARERLQFVSERALEVEQRALVALATSLGLEAQGTVHDPRVPGEPRLRRLTLHLLREGRRVPVVDVFDAAARELVPFVTLSDLGRAREPRGAPGEARAGGRRARRQPKDAAPRSRAEAPGLAGRARAAAGSQPRLGTVFVLLRFRLVDLWTVALLVHLGAADRRYGETVLRSVLADFEAVAASYEQLLEAKRASLLMPNQFVGQAEDAVAEQKMAALRRPGGGSGPYLPALTRDR